MKFSFLIFLLIAISTIESKDKLIFVMTHFRHGHRAPQSFYNKEEGIDFIKEKWENPGELTGIGQRMHFYLGLRNRLRYIEDNKFLSEKYDAHELLIYSSCLNRTIVSVSSQLQGLYPPYLNIGETIALEQTNISKPPVNISLERIGSDIIGSLGENALPNSMTIAPIRMINSNEKKIRLYDTGPCKNKLEEIIEKNSKTLQTLIDIVKEFKDKYGEKFDNFYGKKENYDMKFIENACDAFLSAYPEYPHTRKMEEFSKTGISFIEFKKYCDHFQILNFRDWVLGDEKHSIAHLETSKLMKEFIHYMKERIELDKNGEGIQKFDDYSKPKMMLVSGHDTTVSCFEIFLMEALGENLDFYRYPDFAAQIAFEVTTADDNKKGKTNKEYFVKYYFNDELVFTLNVDDFITKMEKQIWSEENVNKFCGFDDGKKNTDNQSNNQQNNNETLMKIALIIFMSLTGLFLIIIIFLSVKLIKNRKSDSKIYNSLIPSSEEA